MRKRRNVNEVGVSPHTPLGFRCARPFLRQFDILSGLCYHCRTMMGFGVRGYSYSYSGGGYAPPPMT